MYENSITERCLRWDRRVSGRKYYSRSAEMWNGKAKVWK